jgi:hypothetical protein
VDETVEDGLAGADIQVGEPTPGPAVEQVQHHDRLVRPLRPLSLSDPAPEPQPTSLGGRREVVGRHHGIDRDPQPLHLGPQRVH